ncbi:hypothetical protein VaNZ11_003567 [Volvox africanus]|uniref:Bulb-type lectin domain-containing protein n=1 Tax=Volvox africanus TaxID=51714 RepID=A0ABQ5RVM2_9CHLO|nr:hypothetical protein VaNZ11_003567 [Volvox africanus]
MSSTVHPLCAAALSIVVLLAFTTGGQSFHEDDGGAESVASAVIQAMGSTAVSHPAKNKGRSLSASLATVPGSWSEDVPMASWDDYLNSPGNTYQLTLLQFVTDLSIVNMATNAVVWAVSRLVSYPPGCIISKAMLQSSDANLVVNCFYTGDPTPVPVWTTAVPTASKPVGPYTVKLMDDGSLQLVAENSGNQLVYWSSVGLPPPPPTSPPTSPPPPPSPPSPPPPSPPPPSPSPPPPSPPPPSPSPPPPSPPPPSPPPPSPPPPSPSPPPPSPPPPSPTPPSPSPPPPSPPPPSPTPPSPSPPPPSPPPPSPTPPSPPPSSPPPRGSSFTNWPLSIWRLATSFAVCAGMAWLWSP